MKTISVLLALPLLAMMFVGFGAVSAYLWIEDTICRLLGWRRRWHHIPAHWEQFGFTPTDDTTTRNPRPASGPH